MAAQSAQARLEAFMDDLTEAQLVEAIGNVAGMPMMGDAHAALIETLERRFPATAAAAWDVIFADETDTMSYAEALKQVKA